MNVVFISILTFSDLDIALSSTTDMGSFLACGLLPEFNYPSVTVVAAFCTVSYLWSLFAVNTSQLFVIKDLCTRMC